MKLEQENDQNAQFGLAMNRICNENLNMNIIRIKIELYYENKERKLRV